MTKNVKEAIKTKTVFVTSISAEHYDQLKKQGFMVVIKAGHSPKRRA